MSPQALALFRLLERLSKRTGYACVKLLETLAAMLEKSVRAVRYALAELIAAGWIQRQQTRRGGVSKLFFWPLVRVAKRSRGLFSEPPVAGCSAVSSPVALQVTPSTPIKKSPVGTENDNTTRKTKTALEACPVAVSLLKTCVSEGEALELAREVKKQDLTEEQVQRILTAYRSQLANIRNRGAWLREAIRRGFTPPAPTSTHPSDNGGRPIRDVRQDPSYWEWRRLQAAEQKTSEQVKFSQPSQASGVSKAGIEQLRATLRALQQKGS
ncbi:hypothetical protein [Armatimonas rosea]|uniref:Helix-turn-helix domain-containing protein n=1 Tax=Armatimonas rosea TaxID=685828 RepID=A0A7W9SWF2_ARMRO|nr:hypothetical protein [Armatimonas rosea]MBB6054102.1 hypothetical protein [Armatimonas rosea]